MQSHQNRYLFLLIHIGSAAYVIAGLYLSLLGWGMGAIYGILGFVLLAISICQFIYYKTAKNVSMVVVVLLSILNCAAAIIAAIIWLYCYIYFKLNDIHSDIKEIKKALKIDTKE